MSNRLAVIANSVLALLILATLIFAFPFMSSAFYLYRSKENLDRAFQAQGLDPDAWDINKAITESPPPLGDSVKISLAQAIDNLHSAIRWDKRNEQAYRFLLQAYVLQQDFSDAWPWASASCTLVIVTFTLRLGTSTLKVEIWREPSKHGLWLEPCCPWIGKGSGMSNSQCI